MTDFAPGDRVRVTLPCGTVHECTVRIVKPKPTGAAVLGFMPGDPITGSYASVCEKLPSVVAPEDEAGDRDAAALAAYWLRKRFP